MAEDQKTLTQALGTAREQFDNLSSREKMLLYVASLTLVLFGIGFFIFDVIYPAFDKQSQVLTKIERELDTLPRLLSEYTDILNQEKEMEARFNSSDPNVDIPSYIENIINEIEGQSISAAITPRGAASDLGERFRRKSFDIKFTTADMKPLVLFLDKISHGSQPLLITKIELKRLGTGASIRVAVELTSIRPRV